MDSGLSLNPNIIVANKKGNYFLNTIESNTQNSKLNIWNVVDSVKLIKELYTSNFDIDFVKISPNEKYLSIPAQNKVQIYNTSDGDFLFEIESKRNRTEFNGINDEFLSIEDNKIIVWNIDPFKLKVKLNSEHEEMIYGMFISVDGQRLFTFDFENIIIRDANNYNVIKKLVLPDVTIRKFVGSNLNGDLIAFLGFHGELFVYDILNEKIYDCNSNSLNQFIKFIEFSPDSKNIMVVGTLGLGQLINISTGNVQKDFNYGGGIIDSQYSLDGTKMITLSLNGGLSVWSYPENNRLITQYILAGKANCWVHLHPSGLFDASPEAMELMYWTKGLEVIEFAQLKDRYWVPGLWEKVMKGEALPDARNMQELKLQPEVELGEVKDGKIPVTLTKREGGYGKVSILINGKEIQADARGNNFDKSKETQTIWVDLKDHPNLQNGENTIAVKASSEDGFVVGRPEEKKVTMSFQTAKPHFYAVVVGTGKYMNSSINLKYPEKDAESMSTALKLGSEQFFGKENTHIYTLTTTSGERPTKEKIKNTFSEISQKAKSSDVILVYLSGHGITWGGDQSDFYYVTTDATAANSEAYNDELLRKNHLISTAEFTEYLKVIPANKQVMIIDACSSGKAVENLMAARDIDVSQIKAIDRMKDRTGMFVISGSAADAVSYEASRYGQGLLTYSILEAMKGAALRDGQFFDVNTILNYSRENVPRLAAGIGGIQTPQLLIPKGGSFDIGQVDEEAKKQIPLSNIKPVFVRTSFMDTEDFTDVLAISKSLDNQLNEFAIRGKESEIVFLDTREFPESYRLSGGYTQSNGTISLKLKIKGPKESEHQLSGKTKEELIQQIMELVESLE
ncbi:MAG: caspase family protein [Crocinitomicaceae bacterium]|nr:caspase family protein [Crocinitomicaceae bacterium]